MALMVNAQHLGQAVRLLDHPNLHLITEFDYRHPERPSRLAHPHLAVARRMPVLVLGKERSCLLTGGDFIQEPPRGNGEACLSVSKLLDAGLELLLQRLAKPGGLVCDPVMLGRSGLALAARRFGCRFVGATQDQRSADRILREVRSDGTQAGEVDAGNGPGGNEGR